MPTQTEFSNLASVVLARTYARPVNDRIENWPEIVERVIGGNVRNHNVSEKEIERLRYFMLNRKASPAGRGLWTSGTPIQDKLGGASLVNCWAFVCDDWENYVTASDLLMVGGGVGFSVENKYVAHLPKVKSSVSITHKLTKDADYIVPDSREGWCRLLYKVFEAWFVTGKSFTYSTICVRGPGEVIITFGGVSSGPRPLIRGVEKICSIFTSRQGKRLRPIDAADIMCCIAEVVVSGNVRRSAILIQCDASDKELLKAKRWDLGPVPTQRSNANFSVVASDAENDLRPLFWETYKQGEPFGIINLDNCRKYGRMGEKKDDPVQVVNPCFSEDTLIAVADGRGSVSIKQLAEENRDVPVYSLNQQTLKTEIKWARNPRITGHNQKLLQVKFDDGSCIKVTPNHKIPLRDGSVKYAKELVAGDSLYRFDKRQEPISKGGNKYWRVYGTGDKRSGSILEHRMVYRFYDNEGWESKYREEKQNGWHKGGIVIHHKDFDSLNNNISNLQLMTFKEHTTYHGSVDTQGENNGRYSGRSNKELEQVALDLTKVKGRRFSTKEWIKLAKQKGLPTKFSPWRSKGWFATPMELALWAADQCGYGNYNSYDPRVLRTFLTAKQNGYNTKIENGTVFVERKCEKCGNSFWKTWNCREQAYCSVECGSKNSDSNTIEKRRIGKIKTALEKQRRTRHFQIMLFKDLEQQLGRTPSKKEWEKAGRRQGIPTRFKSTADAYKCNPFVFGGFKELAQTSTNYNHRVVSVTELPGEYTVYNLTVDDNHTVASLLNPINDNLTGVFSMQCGEATLQNNEPCNLQDINLPFINNVMEFAEAAKLMHRWGKRVTLEKYHWPQIQKAISENHRIGTSITGCLQRLDLFNPETLDYVYQIIQDENVRYSKELGIDPSIKTTVIKPSGTLSKAFDNPCEGIHPAYSRHFIQRIRIASNDPLISKLQKAGHHMEPQQRLDGTLDPDTMVVDFYVKTPEDVPCADEGFDTWKQLDAVKMAQKHWADQSISVTVYYKDEDVPKIQEWLKENLSEIKTISFLKHSGHNFVQAPKQPITEEEYEKLTKRIKPVEFDNVGQGKDIDGAECAGGACPIK